MNIVRYPFLLVCLVVASLHAYSQSDNVGSGRAISFDGINDYIQIGSHYHDLNLPISASAWIKFDAPTSNLFPIFVTNDDTNFIYRGFWFYVTSSAIVCEIGDGTGGDNPDFRRGLAANFPEAAGRWINVCAVMKSPTDVKLYVNGIDVGGGSVGDSNLPMASSFANDTAKINYQYSNAAVIYRNKGQLDEVRLWNRALSPSEVQQYMCKKLKGNESGLIGYWNFDETSGNTVFDKSSNGFNGRMINNPTRVFSGAPIGDDSKYQYSSNWTGTTLSFQDNSDLVSVNNIQGSPEGIHIYEVKSPPSQTNGLGASSSTQPYFGVFAAALDQDNYLDATYSYQASTSCKLFSRADNSVSTWTNSNNPLIHISNRDEMVRGSGTSAVFDLGPDKILCNQASSIISTGITDPQFSFAWNTGEITPSINVSQSGKYVAKVTGLCGTVKDSVLIAFEEIPPPVSLGDDQALCVFKPIILKALNSSEGYQIQWQDKSNGTTFHANNFGKYWVSVKNDCGVTSDTISFSKLRLKASVLPNVITPDNGDTLNQYFKIDDNLRGNVTLLVLNRWGKEVYRSDNYQNDWDGGGLSAGVYFIVLTGPCIDEVRDILTILH